MRILVKKITKIQDEAPDTEQQAYSGLLKAVKRRQRVAIGETYEKNASNHQAL